MQKVINWFEIPVVDLDRAVRFYEAAMEISLCRERAEMAIFPYESPATSGALVKYAQCSPADQGCVIYLHTPDLAATLQRVDKAGGKCVFGPQTLPDIGSIAFIIDSEGNRIGLHQPAGT